MEEKAAATVSCYMESWVWQRFSEVTNAFTRALLLTDLCRVLHKPRPWLSKKVMKLNYVQEQNHASCNSVYRVYLSGCESLWKHVPSSSILRPSHISFIQAFDPFQLPSASLPFNQVKSSYACYVFPTISAVTIKVKKQCEVAMRKTMIPLLQPRGFWRSSFGWCAGCFTAAYVATLLISFLL